MAVRLNVTAMESSTYVVTSSFTDEDGSPVTPNVATWTLTDESGGVVNNRSGVSMTPATSIETVLSGADLDAGGRENAKLYFTVNAEYNSGALGNNLPLVGQAEIPVEGLLP